jgi:hypothetical protein
MTESVASRIREKASSVEGWVVLLQIDGKDGRTFQPCTW